MEPGSGGSRSRQTAHWGRKSVLEPKFLERFFFFFLFSQKQQDRFLWMEKPQSEPRMGRRRIVVTPFPSRELWGPAGATAPPDSPLDSFTRFAGEETEARVNRARSALEPWASRLSADLGSGRGRLLKRPLCRTTSPRPLNKLSAKLLSPSGAAGASGRLVRKAGRVAPKFVECHWRRPLQPPQCPGPLGPCHLVLMLSLQAGTGEETEAQKGDPDPSSQS